MPFHPPVTTLYPTLPNLIIACRYNLILHINSSQILNNNTAVHNTTKFKFVNLMCGLSREILVKLSGEDEEDLVVHFM